VTSIPAFADDLYQPQVVPACKVYKTTGGDVCGYLNIEDWKSVLRADAELVHARVRLTKEVERVTLLTLQLAELEGQVAIHASSQSIVVQRNSDLTKQLVDLGLKYQQERAKPSFGSPLAWTLAGVSTSLLAGFLISSLIN